MSEGDEHSAGERRGGASVSSCFLCLLLGLVVYVLSPGPVLYVYFENLDALKWMKPALDVFFFPLEWMYDNVEIVEGFYDWYLKFFV